MKLKTRIRIFAALPAGFALIIAAVLWLATMEINEAQRLAEVSSRVLQANFELTTLTQEYLLDAGERKVVQWKNRHASYGELLAATEFHNKLDADIREALLQDHKKVGELFLDLQAAQHDALTPLWRPHVTNQLLIKARDMQSMAAQLANRNYGNVTTTQQAADVFVLLSVAVLAMVSALLSVLLVRSLIPAVDALNEGIRLVADGNLEHEVKITSGDEMGRTAAAFNKMTRALRESTAALGESEARYRTIFEQAVDSIVVVDPRSSQFVHFNDSACRYLGYTREEFSKLRVHDIEAVDSAADVTHRIARIRHAGSEVFETRHRTKTGAVRDVLVSSRIVTMAGAEYIQAIMSDITLLKHAQTKIARQATILDGINKVLATTLTSTTDEEVACECLEVAQALTGSKYGFINEINERGRLDATALTRSAWDACEIPRDEAAMQLKDLEIRSYWGRVITEGKSQIVNDPENDPDQRGTPPGHARIESFLGVPLEYGGKTIGLIGLANKPGGYTEEDRSAIESLSAAFVEALTKKRAEMHVNGLNEELKAHSAQLDATNKELESFSYSVSHDLRAPLRQIDGFAQVLTEDLGPKLDAENKRVVEIMRDSTRRMGQLIDDLLVFSRVGRHTLSMAHVDMNGLARTAFDEIVAAGGGRAPELEMETLPGASGDARLLRQVWANLVSNAVKFSARQSAPRVSMGARSEANELVYWIRDNGAGFDMKYADKLFGVFQRLHSEAEFEGTGIGLALVRRIITRHGGRVWAESEVNRGATFYFSLPRKAAHD